jgi:hypothetical protein
MPTKKVNKHPSPYRNKILNYLHFFKLFFLPIKERRTCILQFITSRFSTGRSTNNTAIDAFCCSGTKDSGGKNGTFSWKCHLDSKRGRRKNTLRTKGTSHRPWREMRFDERRHWMRKEVFIRILTAWHLTTLSSLDTLLPFETWGPPPPNLVSPSCVCLCF